MTPLSRGIEPIEYSVQVTCELGKNIILSPNSEPISLQINNKNCDIINDNGNIIVKANGFSNEIEGKSFFFYLQSYLAKLSLDNDISLSIPSTTITIQGRLFNTKHFILS